ncbi:L-idonate 5-dehydrogenase [Jonesiaceae bacterium BS-20]|uniref:L-idonate 5-dehydrogenase n=1 Tax=Jonesiaceae bacterium BS-20 TaxID=3120821 RepID=A0AAU7DU64_9MICO
MNTQGNLPAGAAAPQALVAYAKDDLRIEPRERLEPSSDQAVIEVAFGGICGSDLHYWRHGAAGDSILRAPMVLGHEVVGTVVQAAADGSGPGVGERVAVHPATPAPGDARYPIDRPNLSPGCTYLGSAARFPHTDGAFARYVNLPTRMLRVLPQELSLRTAAAIEPASVAWHAVAQAGEVAGKSVLVVGSGPIGALCIAVLKRAGAAHITAVDMHDLPLAIAQELGADTVLRATQSAEIAQVEADVVFESSGNHHGLASALAGAVRGGTVVMVGLLPSGPQPVPISTAISRELRLIGSFRFNNEIDEVIAALADNSLVIDPAITHTFGITQALEAFAIAADASVSGKVLIDFAE